MSILARSSGHGDARHRRRRSTRLDDAPGDVGQSQRFMVAEVEHLAGGLGTRRGGDHRVDDVVDVQAVAALRAVAVQRDVVTEQSPPDEHGEEALVGAAEVQPRAVDVGQPQCRRLHAVHACIQQVELLARQLVDAIDVDRRCRMAFVDGQVLRPPIDLPGRRLDHGRIGCDGAHHLEERDVAAQVEIEVAQRILDRREMAHLTGDVEDHVGAVERFGHLRSVDPRFEHAHVEARRRWRDHLRVGGPSRR